MNILRAAALCLAVIGLSREAGAQSIKTNYWTGASGVNTNWSTANNWTNITVAPPTNGAPTAISIAIFTNKGALTTPLTPGTNNNTVDANLTISALQYANWATAPATNFQVTLIPSGNTLTLTNGLLVGTGTDPGGSAVVEAVITGAGGILNVTGGSVNVRQGTGTGILPPRAGWATLDMSGLDTFNMNNARLLVAGDGGSSAFNSRESAIVFLAKTNVITATGTSPAINMAQNNSNGAGGNNSATNLPSYLYLGMTNLIFSDAMKFGADKSAAFVSFNPAFTSIGTPVVRIRGATGSRVSTFSVADNSALGASNQRSLGTVDFSGGVVDALIDLAYVGRGNGGNNTGTDGRPSATGVLTLSAGTINLNNMEVGYQNASGYTGYNASGTVNVNGGTLVVNQSLELSHNSGSGTSSGTLNINGGSVLAYIITTGGGTNAFTVNNGTLSITNAVGTVAKPISSFSITNSTLNMYLVGSTNLVVNTLNIGASPVINNVIALPGIAVYPAQFALVNYTNVVNGDPTLFTLGTLPPASPAYSGYISNNTAANRIDLVLTNGPIGVPPLPQKAVTWNGTVSGYWNSVTTNWISSGQPTNYANQTIVPFVGDLATFDDTLKGTTTVILTNTLTPGSLTVNNSLSNYVFTGSGLLSGFITLVKSGTGSLTLTESSGDNFSGGLAVNGGALVLGDTSSGISGNTTIAAGATLQVGNNNAGGNVPLGNFTNNGALVFNRSDTGLAVGTVIGGTGSLTNNGSGTVTLTGTGTFTGPTVANAGTLALNGNPIGTSSSLTINNGGTVLLLADNSLGNPGTGSGVTVTINAGGTLTGVSTSSHLRQLLTLTGGTLAMGGGEVANQINNGSWDLNAGLTVNGGTATSTISALDVVPAQTGGTIFDVANGGTPSGIDLNVTGTLINGATAAQNDTGIIKNNNGTMALDNNNTFTNGMLINAGTVQLGEAGDVAPLAFPLGERGVTNNALITIASSQSVTVSNVISGTGSLLVGSGTATLAGANTYSGNTTVSNSILQLAGSGSIASSPSLNIISGGAYVINSASGSSTVNFTNGALRVAVALNTASADLTVSTLNLGGAANFIQASNIPPVAAYPIVFPIIHYGFER
jgi:fibronectin-binding autotransporter adhesin